MSVPRIAEVTRLSSLMLDSMSADLRDASSAEVISAMMSMTLTALLAVKQCGGNVEALRPGIEDLWKQLPTQKVDA
jgi:hypothetical protein